METNTLNIDRSKLVSDIKEKSELQKFYKNQRKSVHLLGERKLPFYKATLKHVYNRFELRAMYAVYGLSRGKTFSQIENTHPGENHPLNGIQWKIDKLIKKYQIKEEVKKDEEVLSL
ncbi:MAG: hypothetical protein ACOC2W_03555 [bacterium]